MGWLFKSDEELKQEREAALQEERQEEHNRGQTDGAKASTGEAVAHNVAGHLVHSEEYNKGWNNARSGKWPA